MIQECQFLVHTHTQISDFLGKMAQEEAKHLRILSFNTVPLPSYFSLPEKFLPT